MSLAETIYRHSLRLPEHAAQEALDFIQFLEQRYCKVPVLPEALPDSLIEGAGEEESSLYKALMRIGFIGCIDADEQLSIRYKDEIDFSNK